MLDCLFIGVCTEDVMMRVDALPQSNQRVLARELAHCCGGVAANAAAAMNHLGGKAGIITAVGEDDAGEYIRRDVERQGYAFAQILSVPDRASSISMIHVERDGRRSITHFGGSIDRLTFEAIDKRALEGAKAVHMGAMDAGCMLDVARYVKARMGALVSIDGGNLEGPVAEALLPYCDVYIPDDASATRAFGLAPRDACRYFRSKGVRFACVTAGERGSFGCDDAGEYEAPAHPVQVVDTTGAGDNYHGAFLYALTRGWPTPQCMRFAGAFASLSCRAMGARAGMPSLEEALRLASDELP